MLLTVSFAPCIDKSVQTRQVLILRSSHLKWTQVTTYTCTQAHTYIYTCIAKMNWWHYQFYHAMLIIPVPRQYNFIALETTPHWTYIFNHFFMVCKYLHIIVVLSYFLLLHKEGSAASRPNLVMQKRSNAKQKAANTRSYTGS